MLPLRERASYRVSARLILVEEGRVLLAHHVHPDGRDFWCFPGGGVEAGERVDAAARREAREELGIEAELLGLVHAQELPARGPLLDLFFLARRRAGEPTLGTDPERAGESPVLREIAWVSRTDFARLEILPADLAAVLADGSVLRRTPLPL